MIIKISSLKNSNINDNLLLNIKKNQFNIKKICKLL